MQQIHEFQPIYNAKSKILILGTFPSVKSREQHFYYGHPQNRFWKVLAAICECAVPQTIEEKKQMLLEHGIAIWDVIASCDIVGSSDSSIKNVIPADLSVILEHAPIRQIYANGNKARDLYEKYAKEKTGLGIKGLPSTSPANASYSLEKLITCWSCIKSE
ncbi:MAG: DNA-deoxyinosine glycosylase [Lachnospiraceae bacterium]|nr:DNA-deoxyinosine glycosylase [Lachnospiraceae bacterium]